jgi:hypothetical protein
LASLPLVVTSTIFFLALFEEIAEAYLDVPFVTAVGVGCLLSAGQGNSVASCMLASWRKEELIKNLNLSHVGATTVFYLPFGWM